MKSYGRPAKIELVNYIAAQGIPTTSLRDSDSLSGTKLQCRAACSMGAIVSRPARRRASAARVSVTRIARPGHSDSDTENCERAEMKFEVPRTRTVSPIQVQQST